MDQPILRSDESDFDSNWTDYEAYMPWDSELSPLARYGEKMSGIPEHIRLRYVRTDDPAEPWKQPSLKDDTNIYRGIHIPSDISERGLRANRAALYPDMERGQSRQLRPGISYVIGDAYKDRFKGDSYAHEAEHGAMNPRDPVLRAAINEFLSPIKGDVEHKLIDVFRGKKGFSTIEALRAREGLVKLLDRYFSQ